VCVSIGGTEIVVDASLIVQRGRIHVLLGRSGSGKTTLLRAMAGFERLTSGTLRIDGALVDDAGRRFIEPEDRHVGFVFQDYALFPHMSAGDNVAFGMSPKDEERVERLLAQVGLEDAAARRPSALSGGERQRVALARALAQSPELLLLDEPFSNLDRPLRRRVRGDVAELIRASGRTAVFVTHDAEEAFALADTLSIVTERGRIEQTGTPREVYERPTSINAARLTGLCNLIPVDDDSGSRVETVLGPLEARGRGDCAVIRPEQLRVREAGELGSRGIEVAIERRRHLGPIDEIVTAIDGQRIVVHQPHGELEAGRERGLLAVETPIWRVSGDGER